LPLLAFHLYGPVALSVECLTCDPVYSEGSGSSLGLGGTWDTV